MLYGLCGFFVSLVMTNSSWTQAHIRSLWRLGRQRIWTVFPPCDTSALQVSPRDYKGELTRSLYAVRLAMASVAGRPRPYAVVSGHQRRVVSQNSRLVMILPSRTCPCARGSPSSSQWDNLGRKRTTLSKFAPLPAS